VASVPARAVRRRSTHSCYFFDHRPTRVFRSNIGISSNHLSRLLTYIFVRFSNTCLYVQSSCCSDMKSLSSDVPDMFNLPGHLNLENIQIEENQDSIFSMAGTQPPEQPFQTQFPPCQIDPIKSGPDDAFLTDEQSKHYLDTTASNSMPTATTDPITIPKIPPPKKPSSPYQPKRYFPGSIPDILSQHASGEPETSSTLGKVIGPTKPNGVSKRRMGGPRKDRVRHQAPIPSR
jgi:hypothetical protein